MRDFHAFLQRLLAASANWYPQPPSFPARPLLLLFWHFAGFGSLLLLGHLQRALPRLKWRREQVEVWAVHVPLYSFERDFSALLREYRRFNFAFPLLHDATASFWRQLGAGHLPRLIFLDSAAGIIFDAAGQEAARELSSLSSTRLVWEFEVISFARAENLPSIFADTNALLPPLKHLSLRRILLGGRWSTAPDGYAVPARGKKERPPFFVFPYWGRYLYAVCGGKGVFKVNQDGVPLPPRLRGEDLAQPELSPQTSRLYQLVSNPLSSPHLLVGEVVRPPVNFSALVVSKIALSRFRERKGKRDFC